MAKKGMRPEVKAQKLKNNKVRILVCSTKDCEAEFLVARFNNLGQSRRQCEHCYMVAQAKDNKKRKQDRMLLASLGLV
jgi:hypothetical protein